MTEAGKQGLSCHPMSVPIGYGTSGLGNLYEVIPDAETDATLAEAWRVGYRYFDTSPFYGYGLSELRVGRFLRSVPRQDFILSTKVGRYMTPLRGRPHQNCTLPDRSSCSRCSITATKGSCARLSSRSSVSALSRSTSF